MDSNEEILLGKRYRKYMQNYKGEDFAYWKIFKNGWDNKDMYQVGVLFYDFRKYNTKEVRIAYECIILNKNSIHMSTSIDIGIEKFETMAENFYKTFYMC